MNMQVMSRPEPKAVDSSHTPLPWDVVEATENHGPYITTLYGTTVCDLYAMSDPQGLGALLHGNERKPISFTDADQNAVLIAAAVNSYADMFAALVNVRKLISEAALTGFNYLDGNWAERLFASQAVTSAAIAKAELCTHEHPEGK